MCFYFDLRFNELPLPKDITSDNINDFISDPTTKRIHFSTVHSYSLHKLPDGNGILSLPFAQPFESIARKMLNMDRVLYHKNGKYIRVISNEDEYKSIENLINDLKEIVFLRDCLDLSIALCLHEIQSADGGLTRSALGEHEYQLKYNSGSPASEVAFQEITKALQYYLELLPFFKEVDYILAVPSSRPFLSDVIQKLQGFQFTDISSCVSWTHKQGSLKELDDPVEKLKLIDSWGFKIDPGVDLKNKNVLLVDDMYKSGITMQYVGMKLKEAGVSRVFGISICKALGNK